MLLDVATEWKTAGKLRDWSGWAKECQARKKTMKRKTHFDQVPLKPQRVYEEMNKAFGRDTTYVTTIGLSARSPARSSCMSTSRATGSIAARPARSAGRCRRRSACAPPIRTRNIVALSGDYDFQFMIEELAVGAQHKLPYIHVVVNNAYLGLIRQAQRGFAMDFEVSLAFENINRAGDAEAGYGVDHVAVAEAMGCKAIRVRRPEEFAGAFKEAKRLMKEHQVPVVLEFILERVTNISMGTEIDKIIEFEELAETQRGRADGRSCMLD